MTPLLPLLRDLLHGPAVAVGDIPASGTTLSLLQLCQGLRAYPSYPRIFRFSQVLHSEFPVCVAWK